MPTRACNRPLVEIHLTWLISTSSRRDALVERRRRIAEAAVDLEQVAHATAEDLRKVQDIESDTAVLICLAQSRQGELRPEAKRLGQRLFSEEPGCLVDELAGYWSIWKQKI